MKSISAFLTSGSLRCATYLREREREIEREREGERVNVRFEVPLRSIEQQGDINDDLIIMTK